jgi:serine/threonine-protein kinase
VLVGYDGSVKVVDFGIAKLAAQDGKTRTGGFVGKARYSSPEHVQGQPLDRRSDLFSLGIVLFELTCGRRPFDGDSDFAVMQAIVGGEPPRPSELVPGYPVALEDIVMRALRRDRDARFTTAQELQLAIEDFARHARVALSSAALSAYMGERFEGKVSAWREARRAGRSLSDHIVATATAGTLDLAVLDGLASASPVREVVAPRDALGRSARRLTRRWAVALAAVAMVAGIAGAAWPVKRPDDPAATTGPSIAPAAPAPAPPVDRAEVSPTPRVDPVAAEPPAPTATAPAPVRPKAGNGKRAVSPRPRASRPTTTTATTPTTLPAERAQRWNPDSPLEP